MACPNHNTIGGQRARLDLARAIYSNSQLVILDDIFSAIDTKTAVTLWNRVFCTDLLKGRTVVLVTQLSWLPSEADLAITLENGQVRSAELNLGHIRKPRIVQSEWDTNKDEGPTDAKGNLDDDANTAIEDDDGEGTDVDQEAALTSSSRRLSCESS